MSTDAWTAIAVVAVSFALLASTSLPADAVLVGGLTLLLTAGVVDVKSALAGLSNEGLVTVGVLFVVAAGLRETGGMGIILGRILGSPRSIAAAQARLMIPVATLSAFMNNTPLVAMLLPGVSEWAKKHHVAASKIMIPLSYATILGGTCSIIGTSTNLVVIGLLAALPQEERVSIGFFEIAWAGLPCTVAGIAYLLLTSRWLLPDRRPAISENDDPREYTVEMLVDATSPLVGRTLEEAGLRHLPGMFLMEIDRDGQVLAAVPPETRLAARDRLVFVGVVDSVVDLQRMRGLTPATNQVFKLKEPRLERCLIEAVVSDTCPLAGRTIREGKFRSVYNAVVIAVGRNGDRIRKKIGDIVLRPGDTLLLEAHPTFVEQQRNSRDFYLVSRIEDSSPPRHERTWLAIAILAGMVVVAGTGWLTMLNAALLAAGLMLLTRCLSMPVVRRAVDWQLLVVIAASFGIGSALEASGAAKAVADRLIGLAGNRPELCLAVVYGMTMVFTELLTNNAAAILVFPIGMAAANHLGVDPKPFVMAIMLAASYGFATPLGYQTHLMVYGPGGYRFSDFLRVGIPLNLLLWTLSMLLIPVVWPFRTA